jgi:hypothetical protein
MSFLARYKLLAGLAAAALWQMTGSRMVALDNGVDPANLGKGDWIYSLSQATRQLGGNVASVHDLASLMAYEKSQGMNFIVVKAGEGDGDFPLAAAPQFTRNLVVQAHAAGLKIFGYTRSYGTNIPGEISLGIKVNNLGADGFVIDAEVEWESSRLGTNGPARALQLCRGIKAAHPNRFLGHAPLPIIGNHRSFPYPEFGLHCDAVMPQDYWKIMGVTPAYMVGWMNTEWRIWQNSLTGNYTNAIKPLSPIGQGWSPSTKEITTGLEITKFVRALKKDANPVTTGGYKGVSFWRAGAHNSDTWNAIGSASIGDPNTNPPVILDVTVGNIADTSAIISWNTDASSDSVVEYGTATSYSISITTASLDYAHSINLTGLSASTTYHYRVKSRNTSTRQTVSGDFSFLTNPTGVVTDLIIDNTNATVIGSWFTGHSARNKFGPDYRIKSQGSGASYLQYTPNFAVAGNYQVYEWHPEGRNRAANTPFVITYFGGTATNRVNAQFDGGQWNLLGTFPFSAGSAGNVRIRDDSSGAFSNQIVADAIKFTYVSSAAPPGIVTQPQNQTLNRGDIAAFTLTASGAAPLSYQWRFNGTNIPGATNSSYTLTNVRTNDSGNYSVTVTNLAGNIASSNATLTVNLPQPEQCD